MKIATAGYYVKPNERLVLLGLKGRVVGIGKRFPYGGKFKPEDNNNPFLCLRRETLEETNNLLEAFEDKTIPCALIDFYKGNTKGIDPLFRVLFLICESFEIKTDNLKDLETKGDMEDPNWYDFDNLPTGEDLKPGDELFLSKILNGEKVKGWIWFDENENLMDSEILPAEAKDLIL